MIEAQIVAIVQMKDDRLQEQAIRELAAQSQEVLPALISIFNTLGDFEKAIAIRVLRAIGYPKNAAAIPQVVDALAAQNTFASNEAYQAVREIGLPEIIVPYFIEYLWGKGKNKQTIDWIDGVASLCSSLLGLGIEYIRMCAPVIVYLNSLDLSEEFDRTFLLDVIEELSPTESSYAIPSLISLLHPKKETVLGKYAKEQAKKLLERYPASLLASYKRILDVEYEPRE